jgi:hypothetical protein
MIRSFERARQDFSNKTAESLSVSRKTVNGEIACDEFASEPNESGNLNGMNGGAR